MSDKRREARTIIIQQFKRNILTEIDSTSYTLYDNTRNRYIGLNYPKTEHVCECRPIPPSLVIEIENESIKQRNKNNDWEEYIPWKKRWNSIFSKLASTISFQIAPIRLPRFFRWKRFMINCCTHKLKGKLEKENRCLPYFCYMRN